MKEHEPFPAMTNRTREPGDPFPEVMVHDNNRGMHPAQMKGKVFQALDEIYNNPGKSHNGAIYDSGTYTNGVPVRDDEIVEHGPFNR